MGCVRTFARHLCVCLFARVCVRGTYIFAYTYTHTYPYTYLNPTPYAHTHTHTHRCLASFRTQPNAPLHPTPYTLRPTPYTPHPTPYTPHPTYTLPYTHTHRCLANFLTQPNARCPNCRTPVRNMRDMTFGDHVSLQGLVSLGLGFGFNVKGLGFRF